REKVMASVRKSFGENRPKYILGVHVGSLSAPKDIVDQNEAMLSYFRAVQKFQADKKAGRDPLATNYLSGSTLTRDAELANDRKARVLTQSDYDARMANYEWVRENQIETEHQRQRERDGLKNQGQHIER
ncbi:MAG: hypothetical protein ABL958_02110, partial [Bdellovibrionia bacterium]